MNYAVVIGRFQPFHRAHREIVGYALSKYDKVVIVLGSANLARSIKNPWDTPFRESMIRSCFSKEQNARITFVSSKDYFYSNELWKSYLVSQVNSVTSRSDKKTLVGTKSDTTSWYLDSFPEWNVDILPKVFPFHATNIRELYFRKHDMWREFLDIPVVKRLEEFQETDEYLGLVDEQAFIDKYKKDWSLAPYEPVFVTVDAVVIKSGHVLLVKRGGFPGKGQLALPGGFSSPHHTLEQWAIEELKQESRIDIPKSTLMSSIRASKVFDYPYRSLRGRTITHGFLINLGISGELPSVKGGDDAAHAFWMPLSDVETREREFFEDHAEIIRYFVS